MLAAVDAAMRPLKIPPKFVPYMEKHRIYELFHELATGLIIQQPSDHILYLKQSLRLASKKRDLPRIILLGEPYSKILLLAKTLQKKLSSRPITLRDIHNVSPEIPEESFDEQDVARNLRVILKKFAIDYSGWILVDIPRTRKEARAIQRAGIIPTHVLEIVASGKSGCEEQAFSDRENHLRDLRDNYENLLIKVEAGHRDLDAVADACAILAKRKKYCGAPCKFRVVLIGSRGSGCRAGADHLSRRFNLVHVDFDTILQQVRLQENPLAKNLRMVECRSGKWPNADVRIRIVEKYLLGEECLKKGWVLTGYPITVEDFELLDSLQTPPNRRVKLRIDAVGEFGTKSFKFSQVIFVDVGKELLRARLMNSRCDAKTGNKIDPHWNDDIDYFDEREYLVGFKADRKVTESDIDEYEKNVKSLLKYAGESGTIIDGNTNGRVLKERIEACLIRPAPSAPPRFSRSKRRPEPIEFDPNDEPDHGNFEEIREAESLLSLI